MIIGLKRLTLIRLFFVGLCSVLFLLQIAATSIAHSTERQQTLKATAGNSIDFPIQVHRGRAEIEAGLRGQPGEG